MARNITVDPATLWECSISNTSIIKENVCYIYSTSFNLCCTNISVAYLSCISLYNNINMCLTSVSYRVVCTSLVSFINSSLTSLS